MHDLIRPHRLPRPATLADSVARGLDLTSPWLALLGIRVLLAWEFFEAGREKLRGENWFASLQDSFPLPFNLLPASVNWQVATWAELIGAACLLLGLGTRLAALALMILTVVATATVHWPAQWSSLAELLMGYAITDRGAGNYKLPALFLVMLVPLLLQGAGRLSVDSWLRHVWRAR